MLNKVRCARSVSTKPRLAQSDNMARWYAGDSANAEINAYYDQPITSNPLQRFIPTGARFTKARPHHRAGPAAEQPSRPRLRRCGRLVFSAQEYLRMLQSAKLRLRAPHLLDFPRAMSAGPIRCSRARRCRAEPVEKPTTSATATAMAPA